MKRFTLIKARGDRDQIEIAKLCGVTQQAFSCWELGKTTPPIRKMFILEKIFGVPKEQLFPDVFSDVFND